MPVFDPNVFDAAVFDAAYSVPLMQKAVIQRGYRRSVAGNSIPITLYIQEADTTPGRLFSLNPETSTQLLVYYPNGDPYGVFNMVNKGPGIYTYVVATHANDVQGVYTGRFRMENGDKVTLTDGVFLFEII